MSPCLSLCVLLSELLLAFLTELVRAYVPSVRPCPALPPSGAPHVNTNSSVSTFDIVCTVSNVSCEPPACVPKGEVCLQGLFQPTSLYFPKPNWVGVYPKHMQIFDRRTWRQIQCLRCARLDVAISRAGERQKKCSQSCVLHLQDDAGPPADAFGQSAPR